MRTIRIFFEKRSRAKFISHLDCTRCMQRAIKRARLPVWYTEGFNPHLYMTFALPLALGYEGVREPMDIRLLDESMPLETVAEKLNAVLPEGLRVVDIADAQMKPAAIVCAEYVTEFSAEGHTPAELLELWKQFDAEGPMTVLKKGKKGPKEVDIRPYWSTQSAEAGEKTVKVVLRSAAGTTTNINPNLALDKFFKDNALTPDVYNITRTRILTGEFQDFA